MEIIRPVIITDALFISSNLPETDETVYNAGTTYVIDDLVMVVATHRIYKSLQNSNTGNYPPDNLTGDTPFWESAGATNKWKAFDIVVGNQAEHATVLEYELEPGAINSIAFQNLDAVEAEVIMTDPVDGEVYNKTIPLLSSENVSDWYDYFFEGILKVTDAVEWDLPIYPAATLDISINNGASTVKCGEIVVGLQRNIGRTLWRPRLGILDYSLKSSDPVGSFEITERAYSKTISCALRMDTTIMDEVYRLMALYRATPLVWVATEGYASMIVYGFFRDFQVELVFTTYAECSLEIEGLT